MPVSDVYSAFILEKIIKDKLLEGINPTISEMEAAFDEFADANDLSNPLFNASNYSVARKEHASASKFNNQNKAIEQDLFIAIQSLLKTTDKSVLCFYRWDNKIKGLESRLVDLENRIDSLLLLVEDTDGYFNAVGDHLTNTNLIDLSLSTGITLDTVNNIVKLSDAGTSGSVTRIFLNDITSKDVSFNVVTSLGSGFASNTVQTAPYLAFIDEVRFWKTDVVSDTLLDSVVGELSIRLPSIQTITRIVVQLHSSETNSFVNITPMYSKDGINYSLLPTEITTRSTNTSTEFIFPEITATHFKFIFEKRSFDLLTENRFMYEFGAREISFFAQSFTDDPDETALLISKDLSVTNNDGEIQQFRRATLEVCEEVPSNTSLRYFVAAGNTSEFTPTWHPISPRSHTDNLFPYEVNFTSEETIDISDVLTSYDREGSVVAVSGINTLNPQSSFTLVSLDEDEEIQELDAVSSERRYLFLRSNMRILDHQIDSNLGTFDLQLWRNVGEKGLIASDSVRGIQRGWNYNEPYYETVVLVRNSSGTSFNVGEKPIIIDEVAYTGTISPTILSQGTHKIKVHKDNWLHVTPGLNTFNELTTADLLYPFNHKLLVEGYDYGEDWPTDILKIYKGFDRFASFICDEVSLFDMLVNVSDASLDKFCLDSDLPNASTIDSEVISPSNVLLVNVDETVGDFSNETFLIELKRKDNLFKYIKFKAELRTEDAHATPVLDAYRIKLG